MAQNVCGGDETLLEVVRATNPSEEWSNMVDRRGDGFDKVRARALVVDDDAAAGDLFARILRGAGIDVVVARDGKRALEILEEDSIQLVILDRHMPGMSGLEVIERIRAEQSTVHIPVILVTGDSDLDDRVYGLEHGADDYLSKPVSLDELVARARSQLRRRSPDDAIRQFVESANDAFVSWGSDGAISEWTSQAEALFGWSRPEALGNSFGPFILAPRHQIVHERRMERLLHDRERPALGKWFGLSARRSDGHELAIEMTVWIVSERGNDTFNAFIRDLARRSQMEDALREGARLQTVVNGIRDVIILTDLAGVVVYASPSALSVLGYEAGELYGHLLDEYVHVEDRQELGRTLDRAIAAGSDVAEAQRFLTRDGRHIWMEATTTVVRDRESNDVIGLQIVSHDITRRKFADDARGRATGELARTNRVLRAAVARGQETVEELHALDRIKTDLVSTVSHELRTPLTNIGGYIELLVDPSGDPLSDSQRSMLEVVERNTTRLLLMIENLLTIGTIEVGTLAVNPAPFDLSPAVRTAIQAALPKAHDRGVSIEFDPATDTGLVLADAPQLARVLENLLSNAIKFTGNGGHVSVSTHRFDSEVRVVVSDTGIGIAADDQAKLFTPFFRSDVAIEGAMPGSGLGLAIVKNIVEGHGGTVDLRSALGQGTSVAFTLPVATAVDPRRSEAIGVPAQGAR